MSRRISVCVVQPDAAVMSETFLRNQSERLPGLITVVHGFLPTIGRREVLSTALLARAHRRCVRYLKGMTAQEEATEVYRKVFRQLGASVVLAQYGPTGVHIMDACRQAGVPLVVHFHGFDASETSTLRQHATSYPKLFRDAAAIVAVSRPMKTKLISMGAPPEKTHYNPCGVDCQTFTGAEPATSQPVLLAVGRFVEKKAPHLTLAAFAEARRTCPGARLCMIGDGPFLPRCRDLARDLRIDNHVRFLGAQPSVTVLSEMRRSRAFVQHSVEAPSGDCEGMPVGILEAGACGLPVISTRHAGIPEAVIDRQTGLLVEERDVAGMAEAMRLLLHDADLASLLGRAAREWICSHFNIDDRIGRLWRILVSSARCAEVDPAESSSGPSAAGSACIRPSWT
jgi:glycosyltransferase involved in cell wall biosynthesis